MRGAMHGRKSKSSKRQDIHLTDVDKDIYRLLHKDAKAQHRAVSAHVKHILWEHYGPLRSIVE